MKRPGIILTLISLLFLQTQVQSENFFDKLQKELKPSSVISYKEIAGRKLHLHIFNPEGFKKSDKRPVFVAIHGGGWVGGTPQRFYPYANWFIDQGFIGISVEYRLVDKKKGTTVFDCVKDGRSALRYIRANAKELGIDPNKITVLGGSAGAHVAAGTAIFDKFDHDDESLKVSCTPNAVVLLFPVIDTSSKGYGKGRIGKDWELLSPVHNVRKGLPPTLIFHGQKDTVTPFKGAVEFKEKMEKAGNKCQLVIDPDGNHGHINQKQKLFDDACQKTLEFIKDLKVYEK